MITTKQVKIGFHGNSYWPLWHWEVLTPTTANPTRQLHLCQRSLRKSRSGRSHLPGGNR